ncbi:MAG: hypothetical protein ACQEXJ_17770 [Myxococcota bacterium]
MNRVLVACLGLTLALPVLVTACGDDSSVGTFPRLNVTVDDRQMGDDGGAVSFPPAVQLPVTKEVRLGNPSFEDVRIDRIDWKRVESDTGEEVAVKNSYVEYDFRGAVGSDSFPLTIEAGQTRGLVFDVRYTPPPGGALDDFDPSVLVIESNARSEDGSEEVPRIEVTFEMPTKSTAAKVNPPNYTFSNATPTKPETQEFRIYNDEDVATDPFEVQDISLETPSNEFQLVDIPNLPATVLEPNNPGYQDLVFEVRYLPVDEGSDQNAVLVTTDQSEQPIRVPLDSNLLLGSYEITYSHTSRFDFTNETAEATRSMVITSMGPGPITIRQPRLDGEGAGEVFSWEAIDSAQDPVTNFPRALTEGRAIEFLVTYSPPSGSLEPPNGQLVVPIDKPDTIEKIFDLFAGEPKPKIVLAPATGNVGVSGSVAAGATGTGHVVVYNEGNGDLEIDEAVIETNFGGDPEIFSLVNAPDAGTILAPDDLLVLDVAWDLSNLAEGDDTSESLAITYYDPFMEDYTDKRVNLFAGDSGDNTLPTADAGAPEDYSDAVAGEEMALDGSGSDGGSYELKNKPYVWYLVDKPAGSRARLNVQGEAFVPFVPDVPGSYTVELTVFATGPDSELLYSEPAQVTLEVGAAPVE